MNKATAIAAEPQTSPHYVAPHKFWWAWLETALVLIVFAAYAGWPVPEPNEPHYLSKAKHYWDPAWIHDDFFLDSADSHLSFYATCGWLSRFLSLRTMAMTGRVITWALLAFAWRRLSWSLLPVAGAAVVSAALFVALNENFHMAGEWVVGGFESKGLAYARSFAALAELVRERWNATWILLGAASALHVLVGGWATIAVAFCWMTSSADRPRLKAMLPGLAVGGLLSLWGLLPGLALNVGTDDSVITRANMIYVYERLPHHLAYFQIAPANRLRFPLLVIGWAVMAAPLPPDDGRRRLRSVINATLVFVLIGIGLGAIGISRPEAVAGLLRLYWFRLADALVPLGVALWTVGIAARFAKRRAGWRFATALVLLAFAGWQLAPQLSSRFAAQVPRADKPGKVANYADWRDACAWIAANAAAGGSLSHAAHGTDLQVVRGAQRSGHLERSAAGRAEHRPVAPAVGRRLRHRRRRRAVVRQPGRDTRGSSTPGGGKVPCGLYLD